MCGRRIRCCRSGEPGRRSSGIEFFQASRSSMIRSIYEKCSSAEFKVAVVENKVSYARDIIREYRAQHWTQSNPSLAGTRIEGRGQLMSRSAINYTLNISQESLQEKVNVQRHGWNWKRIPSPCNRQSRKFFCCPHLTRHLDFSCASSMSW